MQIFVLLVLRNTRTELMGEVAVLLRAPNLDVLLEAFLQWKHSGAECRWTQEEQ